jgi:hypothetical protein
LGPIKMTIHSYVKSQLLVSLLAISLGGFLLHSRIHPVSQNASNILPLVSAFISIVIVPLFFSFQKTLAYGYVLNGFSAIVGTIVMSHFSLAHWPNPVSVNALLLKTTLPDIIILWGKFFLGKALFDLEMNGYDRIKTKVGRSFRYPNLGWWLVHWVGLSLVYSLGSLYWR